MNDYFQNLYGVLKNLLNLSDEKIFKSSQREELNKNLESSDFELPAIIVFENSNFKPSIVQNDIDLNNEVRTSIGFVINIFSYDVDELVELENKFINLLGKEKNVIDSDCIRSAKLSYSKNGIERNTYTFDNGKQRYRSLFSITYDDIIISKLVVNPIKMELDKNFQLQVMKQLCLLNEVYSLINNEISKLLEMNNLKEFSSIEEKVSNMSAEIKNQYQKLLEQKNSLIEQIKSMYSFENLCKTRIYLDDNGFKECYNYMIKDKLDITNATGKYKKRREDDEEKKRKEAEQLKNLRKHFSKSGDKQLNRYTDAVVEDIKKNLSTDFDLPIYGGSTFSEWYRLFHDNKITYPNVLVFDGLQYNLSFKSFENEDFNSSIVSHNYNTSALPVAYWFEVRIFTGNQEQVNSIEKQIINAYSNEKKITIPDFNFENENTRLLLQIDKDVEIERKQFGILYRTRIRFKKHNSVYYVRQVNADECIDNQRFQLRVLQQVQYFMLKHSQVVTAIYHLEKNYKALIERKRSFLGLFDTDEYKKVRNLYNSNMPISKELFDSAFKCIVTVYPDLYQKFMSGCPYEQINNDLNGLKIYCNSRINLLLNALNIPKTFRETLELDGWTGKNASESKEISVRTEEAIKFIIEKMDDPYCVLENLYDEYKQKVKKEIEEEAERRRIAQEEREAMREEEYYEGGGGSSFLGDIFKTATGVAIGNKMSHGRSRSKKELNWHYTCSLSCPRRGKGYGRTKCPLDPRTCGHGMKY
jgi:hypothetical protein